MKICLKYKQNGICFYTKEDQIIFRGQDGEKSFHYLQEDALTNLISSFAGYQCYVETEDDLWCKSCADGILAICISKINPYIFYANECYSLTFSHAFPLFELESVQRNIILNIDLMVRTDSLIFKSNHELVLFYTADNREELNRLMLKNKRRIKRGKELKIVSHNKIERIFTQWTDFYKSRFDRQYTEDEIQAFTVVFGNETFIINDYLYYNVLVASNLLYIDKKHKIIFDVLAPWNLAYKKMGMGIYSILYSVKYACENGYNYSLCYGNFLYKLNLLEPFFSRIDQVIK